MSEQQPDLDAIARSALELNQLAGDPVNPRFHIIHTDHSNEVSIVSDVCRDEDMTTLRVRVGQYNAARYWHDPEAWVFYSEYKIPPELQAPLKRSLAGTDYDEQNQGAVNNNDWAANLRHPSTVAARHYTAEAIEELGGAQSLLDRYRAVQSKKPINTLPSFMVVDEATVAYLALTPDPPMREGGRPNSYRTLTAQLEGVCCYVDDANSEFHLRYANRRDFSLPLLALDKDRSQRLIAIRLKNREATLQRAARYLTFLTGDHDLNFWPDVCAVVRVREDSA